MSLIKKGAEGIKWSLIQHLSLQFLTIFATIILTRILVPEDFGLVAIITVFLSVGKAMVEGGLTDSLIRNNNTGPVDYSTVFFSNLGVSIFIYGLLFFTAPYISSFYEDDRLTILIRLLTLNLIFEGFSIVQEKLLVKEMKFKKLALLKLPGIIFGSTAGIIAALSGLGIWSILIREILIRIIDACMIWSKSSWRPSFVFDSKIFKIHFNFGYKLFLTTFQNMLFTEIYSLVIGKLFSLSTLGFYNRAHRYNTFPRKMIINIISNPTLSIFSKILDNREKISKIFKRLITGLFFVLAPLFMLMAAIAKPAFIFLITDKWIEMVPYFQIMIFGSILNPLILLNSNITKVFGRTDLNLKAATYGNILVLLALIVGFFFGLKALLWTVVFNNHLFLLIKFHYSSKLIIDFNIRKELFRLIPTLGSSYAIFFLGSYILGQLNDYHEIAQIGILTCILIPFYLVTNVLIKNRGIHDSWYFLKSVLITFKRK